MATDGWKKKSMREREIEARNLYYQSHSYKPNSFQKIYCAIRLTGRLLSR